MAVPYGEKLQILYKERRAQRPLLATYAMKVFLREAGLPGQQEKYTYFLLENYIPWAGENWPRRGG